MPLFAAVEEGVVAVVVTLTTIGGGAVVWVANYVAGRHDKTRAERKEDEKTIVEHLTELVDRLEKEIIEQREDSRKLRDQLRVLTGHVRYLEGIMEGRGIQFHRWDDVDAGGSGPHKPLTGQNPVVPKPSPGGEQ